MSSDNEHCMRNTLIERAADDYLYNYITTYNKVLEPPIDVAHILDMVDDFCIKSVNLKEKYNDPDALGAIYFEDGERLIEIDNSIDPDDPKCLGRYNFTVAHEAGHWVLHAPEILADSEQTTFSFYQKEPAILCRSYHTSMKPERERQADRFASYILMPKDLVLASWRSMFPELDRTMNVYEEVQELREKWHITNPKEIVPCHATQDMAAVFAVSKQAMHIRLKELNLINDQKDNQLYLF